jgi:hypothetical protein
MQFPQVRKSIVNWDFLAWRVEIDRKPDLSKEVDQKK